jgi:hypothetical protein
MPFCFYTQVQTIYATVAEIVRGDESRTNQHQLNEAY